MALRTSALDFALMYLLSASSSNISISWWHSHLCLPLYSHIKQALYLSRVKTDYLLFQKYSFPAIPLRHIEVHLAMQHVLTSWCRKFISLPLDFGCGHRTCFGWWTFIGHKQVQGPTILAFLSWEEHDSDGYWHWEDRKPPGPSWPPKARLSQAHSKSSWPQLTQGHINRKWTHH